MKKKKSGLFGFLTRSWTENKATSSSLPKVKSKKTHSIPDILSTPRAYNQNRLYIRIRELEQSNYLVAGALSHFEARLAGERGLTVESRPRRKDGSVDLELGRAIHSHWSEFCTKPLASSDTLDFVSVLKTLIRMWLRDGEVFVILGVTEDNKFKIQIKGTESLESFGGLDLDREKSIKRDAYGKPLSYAFKDVTVDACDVIHLMRRSSASDSRGISIFAPVLFQIEKIQEFDNINLRSAQIQKQIVGCITTEIDSTRIHEAEDYDDEDSELELADDVKLLKLQPGQKMEIFTGPNSSLNSDNFYAELYRKVATGVGIEVEAISNKFTSSYSASRQSMLNGDNKISQLWQELVSQFGRPLYRRYTQWLIANHPDFKDLDLDEYHEVASAEYHRPRLPSIDPRKDADAARLLVASGLRSRTSVMKEAGYNFEEEASNMAREQEIAEEHRLLSLYPKEALKSDLLFNFTAEEPDDDSDEEDETSSAKENNEREEISG